MEEEQFQKLIKERWSGCMVWFMILFCIFIISGIIAALLIAQIGIAHIPVLSTKLFRSAEPSRIVSNSLDVRLIEKKVEEKIVQAYKSSQGKFVTVSLDFTEEEVTAMLSNEIKNQVKSTEGDVREELTIKKAQVVFEPSVAELYIDFEGAIPIQGFPNLQTASSIVLRVSPSVKDGMLQLNVLNVTVGSLRLPKFMVSSIVSNIAASKLDLVNEALGRKFNIKTLSVDRGKVSITADLKIGEAFTIEQVPFPSPQ